MIRKPWQRDTLQTGVLDHSLSHLAKDQGSVRLWLWLGPMLKNGMFAFAFGLISSFLDKCSSLTKGNGQPFTYFSLLFGPFYSGDMLKFF